MLNFGIGEAVFFDSHKVEYSHTGAKRTIKLITPTSDDVEVLVTSTSAIDKALQDYLDGK